MIVYLAGPMSSKKDFNFPAFNKVAETLREAGHTVSNPAENFGGKTDLPREAYIQVDLENLLRCEAIVLLPGWQDSRGAVLEYMVARETGKKVYQVASVEEPVLMEFAWIDPLSRYMQDKTLPKWDVTQKHPTLADMLDEQIICGLPLPMKYTEQPTERRGDPRFHAVLKEMGDLHTKKAQDYGSDVDSLANIRASEEIGIPAPKGAWLRAKDKVKRIDQYFKRGSLANESLEDSLLDLSAYAIIALVLFREQAIA